MGDPAPRRPLNPRSIGPDHPLIRAKREMFDAGIDAEYTPDFVWEEDFHERAQASLDGTRDGETAGHQLSLFDDEVAPPTRDSPEPTSTPV